MVIGLITNNQNPLDSHGLGECTTLIPIIFSWPPSGSPKNSLNYQFKWFLLFCGNNPWMQGLIEKIKSQNVVVLEETFSISYPCSNWRPFDLYFKDLMVWLPTNLLTITWSFKSSNGKYDPTFDIHASRPLHHYNESPIWTRFILSHKFI